MSRETVFEAENASPQMGLEPTIFGFVLNSLPFHLPRPDISYSLFFYIDNRNEILRVVFMISKLTILYSASSKSTNFMS